MQGSAPPPAPAATPSARRAFSSDTEHERFLAQEAVKRTLFLPPTGARGWLLVLPGAPDLTQGDSPFRQADRDAAAADLLFRSFVHMWHGVFAGAAMAPGSASPALSFIVSPMMCEAETMQHAPATAFIRATCSRAMVRALVTLPAAARPECVVLCPGKDGSLGQAWRAGLERGVREYATDGGVALPPVLLDPRADAVRFANLMPARGCAVVGACRWPLFFARDVSAATVFPAALLPAAGPLADPSARWWNGTPGVLHPIAIATTPMGSGHLTRGKRPHAPARAPTKPHRTKKGPTKAAPRPRHAGTKKGAVTGSRLRQRHATDPTPVTAGGRRPR